MPKKFNSPPIEDDSDEGFEPDDDSLSERDLMMDEETL